MSARHLLFVVSEDWYFCSHRLPLGIAAREAGYRVSVATRVNQHADKILEAGLELVPMNWSRRSTHPLREAASLRELCAIYRKLKPDIVHHVALKPVLYGSLAARLTGVPFVVNAIAGLGYIFSSDDTRARALRPLVRLALRALLDRANAKLILQNEDDATQLVREGIIRREHLVIIPGSGVDLTQFTPTPEPPGPPLVVLPARLLRDKGVYEFVAAARQLRAEGVEARFALVGAPDPENPASVPDADLAAWRDEGVVELWGWRQDMVEVFRQAHIVCLPSYREGLPKALMEAAACGRPIVTTDVPGCRDVVRDGENGSLVRKGQVDELALALGQLLHSPDLRAAMGSTAHQLAEAEFTVTKVAAQTLAVYARATPIRLRRSGQLT